VLIELNTIQQVVRIIGGRGRLVVGAATFSALWTLMALRTTTALAPLLGSRPSAVYNLEPHQSATLCRPPVNYN